MSVHEPLDLEAEIRRVPGVLGVALLNDPVELQVFTRKGTSEDAVRQAIARILSTRSLLQKVDRVFVFEFAGSSRVSGLRPGRPLIGNIALQVSGPTAEARVELVLENRQSEGTGTGPASTFSLRVVAATTLEAAQAFLGQKGIFSLEGASLVEAIDQRVVLVFVNSVLGLHNPVVGASIVTGDAIHQATVRAALDAVNRHLALALT